MRIALSLLLLSSASSAQLVSQAYAQRSEWIESRGPFVNATAESALVDSHIVRRSDAPALRLFFRELELGAGDWIDISSLHDGETQRLRAEHTAAWQSSTAWFNGDALLLELWAAPGSDPAWEGQALLVGLDGVSYGEDTICGTDDRVHSSDDRAARFLNSSGTSACTGWLGPPPCAFTAGHCVPTYGHLAEWNVPPSTTSGALQHPAPEFQFPIDMSTIQGVNGGTGNDYALMRLFPNSLGEDAHVKFPHFAMGFFLPATNDEIRITGYGADTGVDDQVQQTNSGPYVSTIGTQLTYATDTMGGNSGSPVIDEATQQAIGIHTHGGCTSGGGSNTGTSLLNAGFQQAYFASCDPQPPTAFFAISDSSPQTGQSVFFQDLSSGVPTSWAWDLDGDGLTDSVQQNPSFQYPAPGSYDVSLSVTNALGSDTLSVPGALTVAPLIPTSAPLLETFDGGLPQGAHWTFASSNEFGSIVTGGVNDPSPGSGDPALAMSSTTNGNYVLNEAVLHVHLSGASSASLSYWGKSTLDEADPQDGLWISDGTAVAKVVDHGSGFDAWTQVDVDLAAEAAQAGLDLGNDFRIAWRQYDNYPLGTDGFLVDDISITSNAPSMGSNPEQISGSTGGSVTFVITSSSAHAGEIYLLLGSTTGVAPALPLGGGALLPLVGDAYTNFTLSSVNSGPLQNTLGTLGPDGRASAQLILPPGVPPSAIGLLIFHAALGFDPLTGAPRFATNATLTGITN